MARRSSTAEPEVTEDAVTETDAEVTEDSTETPAEESTTEAPKAEDKPIDLGPFQAAAEDAITKADASTGDLPKDSLDAVNKVYREIEGVKGKNQARGWLDEQMKAAIIGKDITRARTFVMLKDNLSAGSGTAGPKAPADPTQAFIQKVAALRLATDEVTSNVPEGVGEDWSTKADELLASLADEVESFRAYQASEDADAEQPEVSPVVRQAFKFAAGRGSAGGGGSRVAGGPRRDIEKHLIQVFDGLDVGSFMTVNEIAKAHSTEYGDDRPSAGAVSARLFPKGREPYAKNGLQATNEDGKVRGATKVA
jgi:hypothetical protein